VIDVVLPLGHADRWLGHDEHDLHYTILTRKGEMHVAMKL